MNVNFGKRICSLILVFAFVILLIPSFEIQPKAAEAKKGMYHFQSGDVAVINQALIDDIASDHAGEPDYKNFAQSPSFVIEQGVYSVIVQGPFTYNGKAITVNIVFGTENNGTYTGVTIDRTQENVTNDKKANAAIGNKDGNAAAGRTTLEALYNAGVELEKTDPGRKRSNNSYYVPTAPFHITGGAKVNALFLGNCTIKAGTNRAYVTRSGNNGNYTYDWETETNRAGYAGIQVDGDCSLTILDVTGGDKGLQVYGSYQLPGATINGRQYSDKPLEVNPIFDAQSPYAAPSGANYNTRAGGAAIGGGAKYNTENSTSSTYTEGTPGEIIINGGKIYAVGGHLAAAIGGGFNSASTTSKIEINGGDITAIGGRFATGIGDGDSLDKNSSNGNPKSSSPSFLEPAQIIINGGTITAYGGTSAAAIGTTDEISDGSKGFGANAVSGLSVMINGGTINAQSGQAGKEGNFNVNSVYTSAIGAGQGSNMKENSITIHSAATVFARSYSQYAISNWGTEAKVPMVNIDPDGFMYLARFQNQAQGREMTLYPVFRDTDGNPVAVRSDAYRILEQGDNFHQYYTNQNREYYAVMETLDSGGHPQKILYKVNRVIVDSKPVFTPALDANNEYQILNTNGQTQDFSYYYDVSAGQEFVVPQYYQAVALSLPKGDYVFHVPKSNDTNLSKDIYAHFSKHLSGTTSASIEEKDFKNTHFSYQNGAITSETPNVNIDNTATGLTHLEVIAIKEDSSTVEMIGENFKTTVLGYQVYIPNDSKSFDLDLSFLYSSEGKTVQKISITQSGVKAQGSSKDTFEFTGDQLRAENLKLRFTYTQTSTQYNSRGEIWINKIDTINNTQVYITYKVVVICKPQYYIHTEIMSKKYDGLPVTPIISKVTEKRGETLLESHEPHYAYGTTLAEYGSHVSSQDTSIQNFDPTTGYEIPQRFYAGETPVTIRYTVVPNETETSISFIAKFTYMQNGVEINKRSTVNINMDGPELVFILDDSSDHVLMASQRGGYKIETQMTVGTDGSGPVKEAIGAVQRTNTVTWTISIVYYDNNLQEAKDDVLKLSAQEVITYTEQEQAPQISGDGKPVYASVDAALAQAKKDAEDAFEKNLWETRYSDSYFFTNGIRKTETFNMTVKHPQNSNIADATFTIQDDYKFRYHKFHYYAELQDEGEEIPFTDEQIAAVENVYYRDFNGNGVLDDEDKASISKDAPSDAGDYILLMDYVGEEYEAHAAIAFEIRKRPIRIVGIENWLTYLEEETIKKLHDSDQPTYLKIYPENPSVKVDGKYPYEMGVIYFDDVISGDVIELSDSIYAYYNEITISYNEQKITLRYDQTTVNGTAKGYQVDWLGDKANDMKNGKYANANRNYELTGVSNFDQKEGSFSFTHVPGMLSYISKGTIFKLAERSVWRKFWPTWSETFLKWNEDPEKTDDFGNYTEPDIMEENIDYYSPSNASHQDYVFLRTVNANRDSTYSIDIEYGDMSFTYAKAVWDVNTHKLVETNESYWGGNDGGGNYIQITNLSDEPITYTATYEKNALWGMSLEMGFSASPGNVTDMHQPLSNMAGTIHSILSGTKDDTSKKFYFIVGGRPVNTAKTQVGSILLTIQPISHADD